MRIWVEHRESGFQVNFQPDSPEEEKQLDQLLDFEPRGRRLSMERDRTIEQGAGSVASLGGHESQRWIIIRTSDH